MGRRDENERVVRRILEAIDQRDVAVLQSSLDPDAVWHDLGSGNPLGGDYVGAGAVMTFMAGTFEMTGDTLRMDVHDVTSSDRHVVALIRLTGSRAGKTLDDNTLFVAAVKDGRVTEVWSYAADQAATNEFWA
jgi:ketosteroid isomerase-like protein